jgi:hypothetical protein
VGIAVACGLFLSLWVMASPLTEVLGTGLMGWLSWVAVLLVAPSIVVGLCLGMASRTTARGRKRVVLFRAALMSSLILSSWAIGEGVVVEGPPVYVYYPSDIADMNVNHFFMFFGPIVAGLYAGATSRTTLSAIYMCLLAVVAAAVAWTILYYYLSEVVFPMLATLSFLLLPVIIGVDSALAIRRAWGRVAGG